MKMVMNIFEGNITGKQKKEIQEHVWQYEGIISLVDALLQKNENNDDIAIHSVNIIICYNSINKHVDSTKVRGWILKFVSRFNETTENKEVSDE